MRPKGIGGVSSMREAESPVPFVAMYQRVLRIKQAMDQEETAGSTDDLQTTGEEIRRSDPLPFVGIGNDETDILSFWDDLQKREGWKKWEDGEEGGEFCDWNK
jgi:hypothetical protein